MDHRVIHAPRGAQLNCKGWHQEAALRCLMNNLDPDVPNDQMNLIVYGGAGKAARNWACFDAIVRELQRARKRRNVAGPIGQAGRRLPHTRICSSRFDCQLKSRRRVGQLGTLSRARTSRPDDVWPDDRRELDLHRHARHRSGHV